MPERPSFFRAPALSLWLLLALSLPGCHRSTTDATDSGTAMPPPSSALPSDPDAASFTSAANALDPEPSASDAATREPAFPNFPVTETRPGFRRTSIDPSQLAKIFAGVPELLRIGRDLRYFTEGDIKAIIARTGAEHEGVTFVAGPVLWSPESGAELLVATGRGKTMSFVVALWTLPDDHYRFASAFLMLNDLSPVVLAYASSRRKELRWTSCWGCPGEEGFVSYHPDDHRVVIVQQ